METQTFEGTFMEVKRQLSALPLKPEDRLRVIVTEPETTDTPPAPFIPTEFRNGLPLLPHRALPEPITLELVKRLSEGDEEEAARAYRTARH